MWKWVSKSRTILPQEIGICISLANFACIHVCPATHLEFSLPGQCHVHAQSFPHPLWCESEHKHFWGLGGVDKKLCLWDIQASNLTLVAKLIQGHKYRDVYILYLCMPFALSSFNFPHLGYLITRLSWCLLLRTITVTCNFDKHEEKEKESTSCGRWWPDVYGILRWSHGHSDSHVEKHSIMAGFISNVHNISSAIHLRSQLQCSEFC